MFVRTLVKEGVNENAILIPQQSVPAIPRAIPMRWLLMLPKGRAAETAARSCHWQRVACHRWTSSGERVIAEGMQKARPGAMVKAIPFVENGAKQGAGASTPAQQPAPAPAK